jgi:hypothetical protein
MGGTNTRVKHGLIRSSNRETMRSARVFQQLAIIKRWEVIETFDLSGNPRRKTRSIKNSDWTRAPLGGFDACPS